MGADSFAALEGVAVGGVGPTDDGAIIFVGDVKPGDLGDGGAGGVDGAEEGVGGEGGSFGGGVDAVEGEDAAEHVGGEVAVKDVGAVFFPTIEEGVGVDLDGAAGGGLGGDDGVELGGAGADGGDFAWCQDVVGAERRGLEAHENRASSRDAVEVDVVFGGDAEGGGEHGEGNAEHGGDVLGGLHVGNDCDVGDVRDDEGGAGGGQAGEEFGVVGGEARGGGESLWSSGDGGVQGVVVANPDEDGGGSEGFGPFDLAFGDAAKEAGKTEDEIGHGIDGEVGTFAKGVGHGVGRGGEVHGLSHDVDASGGGSFDAADDGGRAVAGDLKDVWNAGPGDERLGKVRLGLAGDDGGDAVLLVAIDEAAVAEAGEEGIANSDGAREVGHGGVADWAGAEKGEGQRRGCG